ncbi:phosphatidylserine decarboxylase family protein [Rhodothermus marinus]|uniref:Phosphatidylserine decarboxylase proenzyme n=1 Tax=Rhodothermus marinus (strain ATCC 43812 / DSM 4252 / R-10) TaxID=518766 RepID=D0MKG6_RHOM4|nr:phosphatidylserine decarboxylase family protein [Rhodothermus marinus]ACY48878.1 phosphatidylserine decarboxylase related protein [Rhodothermus marinus DSM 4252]
MMLAPEGYPIVGGTALLAVLLAVGAYYWLPGAWRVVGLLLAVLLLGFVLYFFRDPERHPPEGAEALLLAPADGKVVEIVDVDYEPVYLKGPARRLSIFLSPLDVHVNRVPADGVIELVRYIPGDYLVAWHPKASEKNERSEIGLRHPSGNRILFKQIAGVLARRIVFHLKEGDTVRAGQRFGIVRFGSRMDVIVPPHIRFEVKVGDRVRAGETVLGRLVARPETEAVGVDRLHNH